MATPNKSPGPAVMIKAEPGSSRSSSLRLPSFKPPRDMMLGGPLLDVRSTRKVYVPNLNVQRKKNQEEVSVKAESGVGRGASNQKGGRGRGDRGGKRKTDFVQSTGSVFAEGLANDARLKRESKSGEGGGAGGGGGGRGGRNSSGGKRSISKSKSRIALCDSVDKDDKLAYLLKEGFIDDPGICPDETNKPRQLPSLKFRKNEDFKIMKSDSLDKTEIVANGAKVKPENETGSNNSEDCNLNDVFTFSQLFKSSSPKYILIKLPSGLSTPEDIVNEVARPSTSVASTEDSEKKTSKKSCSLPEGRIGTMQLMKSGQVRFLIGGQLFDANLGTQSSIQQDLMVVNVQPNGTGGETISLGSIDTNIITSRRPIDTGIIHQPK